MIAAIEEVAAVALCAVTIPGTVELLVLTLAGCVPARRGPAAILQRIARIAIVVPAHNEEGGVALTVKSLRGCIRNHPAHSVVVVADNCDDGTAELARAAGARVLERSDPAHRGKGFALEYAFEILLLEGFGAMVVVDADSEVGPNFLTEIEDLLSAGADAVQCRYAVLNPHASMRTRLMNVALLAFNLLRPRGRERLGLSVGILGNGFALTRETLTAVPYDAHSVVEDLEYHLRLTRRGKKVRFAESSVVMGAMPAGGAAAGTQRARWEGGRLRMIREQVPGLIADLARGRWQMIEPLFELMLLPLAFQVALLTLTVLIPLHLARLYAAFALAIVGLHVVAALVVGGGTLADFAALAWAPVYIVWKLALAPVIARAARKNTDWVRTARSHPEGGSR